MKSTIHAGPNSGGESDYFERPSRGKTMKAAILLDGEQGDIIVLPDETKFDAILADNIVAGFAKPDLLSKIFKLGA